MFYLIAEFHEQYLHLINYPVLSNTYSIYKKKKNGFNQLAEDFSRTFALYF